MNIDVHCLAKTGVVNMLCVGEKNGRRGRTVLHNIFGGGVLAIQCTLTYIRTLNWGFWGSKLQSTMYICMLMHIYKRATVFFAMDDFGALLVAHLF